MTLLREFDEADGWQLDGQTSFAAWLSYRTGMSPGAARERVRVATALAGLPLIDAAFGSAEISYSKARAATRVATAGNEEVLLTSARGMSAAELEKLCAMVGSVGNDTEAEPERRFSQRAVGDGMIRMTVAVPADEALRLSARRSIRLRPRPIGALKVWSRWPTNVPAGTRPIETQPKWWSEAKPIIFRA